MRFKTLVALTAIVCLGTPPDASACLRKLSPQQRAVQQREEASRIVQKIDEYLPKANLADSDLVKVRDLRGRTEKLIAAGRLSKAIDAGIAAGRILGLSYFQLVGSRPTKCG